MTMCKSFVDPKKFPSSLFNNFTNFDDDDLRSALRAQWNLKVEIYPIVKDARKMINAFAEHVAEKHFYLYPKKKSICWDLYKVAESWLDEIWGYYPATH